MADSDRQVTIDRGTMLAHFQEVTGLTDPEQCRNILNMHNWNLETAVQDALTIQEGGQPVFTPPTPRPQASPLRLVQSAEHRQGWWEWLMGWAFFPIRLVISTITELTQLIFNVLLGNRLPAPAQDPHGDVLQFTTEFETQYGQTHPPFLQCSYGEALEQIKTNIQFLVVYLHSSGHQDTPKFCREVLSSELFIDTLSSNNCQIFAVSVDSEEGTRVSYILRETTYPFMALIMLRGSRMTVVGRLEGYISLNDVVSKLQQLFIANEAELVVLRNERMQRNLDQQIRREQEEEYMRSLQADKEKVRKREEEEQRLLEAAREERMRELKEKEELEAYQQEKIIRASRLPPEPSADDPNCIHINIKLPNGQRLDRRFRSDDALESVYDLAYSYEDIPRKFMLVINFPRKELHCDERGGPLLSQLELGRKCTLYVQDNTE